MVFIIGEGGGALILETEEHALKRGATIYAELLGCANNTDAFNPVAPDPDGIGAAECMRACITSSQFKNLKILVTLMHTELLPSKAILPNVLQFALYSTLTMYPLVPQKVRQVI